MPNQERNQRHPRISVREMLEALNELIPVLNSTLPENNRLHPVKTSRNISKLREQIKKLSPGRIDSASPSESSNQKGQVVPASIVQALLSIATNAWRIRTKMTVADTGEAKQEMSRVFRHLEGIYDALLRIDIEIRDIRGRPYDSGMALKVVSFEPTLGLSKEEVTETIKPSIIWQGQLVQMGEVIVGTPQVK